jgi:hypothetical protein
VSALPEVWFVPADALPDAGEIVARLAGSVKAVALVGYHDDADASAIAPHLPYGIDGGGIEEIVFVRTGPATGQVVEFTDEAWPGEDRTYVQDDLDAAIELVLGFAAERGAQGAVVLVTGRPEFVREVADKLRGC